MQQGWLRDNHTGLIAAIAQALLKKDAVMWFQGDFVRVYANRRLCSYEVPLGVHTNKRKLTFRPGPLVRFTNAGVEVLGTLFRYRKPWKQQAPVCPYVPLPIETPYGISPKTQLLAETLALLGGGTALIHDLVDKRTHEPDSLVEAANIDHVVGALNEKILAEHDAKCIERMQQEALPKYRAAIK